MPALGEWARIWAPAMSRCWSGHTADYPIPKVKTFEESACLHPWPSLWVRARWDDHPFAHSPSWLPTPRFHRQLTWTPPALLLSGLSGRTLIEIISDDIICLMVTLWPWGQTTHIPLYLGTFENSHIELEHFFISKVAKNKIIAFHWSPFAPDHNWGET